MKISYRICIFPSIALALVGCTTYWQHIDPLYDSQRNWDRDAYNCEMEAARSYPVAVVTQTYGTGYTTASSTNCNSYGGFTKCTTTPGRYVPPPTSTVDVNETNRFNAEIQCLRAAGWRQCKSKDSCQASLVRQKLNTSTPSLQIKLQIQPVCVECLYETQLFCGSFAPTPTVLS